MDDYKVLITTSGIGSRLDELTKYMNKALVRVGKRPSLSYILDRFPRHVPVVVTLGHRGDQVRQFLEIAHPERTFEFVTVERYQGPGTSLGYSMLETRNNLQCPFVFVACDTLVFSDVGTPECNWIGVARGDNNVEYSTVTTARDKVRWINPKGAMNYDYIHIGLVGIKDHQLFWETLEELYKQNPDDSSLNDCAVINEMIHSGVDFGYRLFPDWLDIGNVKALQHARTVIYDSFENLDKSDEAIYLFEPNTVVKFFHNPALVENRVARAKVLGRTIPQVEKSSTNFYIYEFIEGDVFRQDVNEYNIDSFLEWCSKYLWKPVILTDEQRSKFGQVCREFYDTKTRTRLAEFHKTWNIPDTNVFVNGERIPSVEEMLQMIDWDWLSDGIPTTFHGDLHFENVIAKKNGVGYQFKLVDWRQDFGGIIEYGDIYYDLAKLNHGMIVSHDIIKKNLFTINVDNDIVVCDIMRNERLVRCQRRFYEYLQQHRFDIAKVDILTNLIFLNIAPLHHYPYNWFLYFFGRDRLWTCIHRTL